VTVRLEHANLIVRDIDGIVRFLQTAFPEFHVRHDGTSSDGRRWVHVGTDDTYLALSQADIGAENRWVPYSGVPGVNHLAYEVDDAVALRTRLLDAGYRESTPPNSHPYRRRVYFNDAEGNDWEFVEYLSDDSAKRNDYELPDA